MYSTVESIPSSDLLFEISDTNYGIPFVYGGKPSRYGFDYPPWNFNPHSFVPPAYETFAGGETPALPDITTDIERTQQGQMSSVPGMQRPPNQQPASAPSLTNVSPPQTMAQRQQSLSFATPRFQLGSSDEEMSPFPRYSPPPSLPSNGRRSTPAYSSSPYSNGGIFISGSFLVGIIAILLLIAFIEIFIIINLLSARRT
jgi:hypothetical protein